jgi:hypothetical protein
LEWQQPRGGALEKASATIARNLSKISGKPVKIGHVFFVGDWQRYNLARDNQPIRE